MGWPALGAETASHRTAKDKKAQAVAKAAPAAKIGEEAKKARIAQVMKRAKMAETALGDGLENEAPRSGYSDWFYNQRTYPAGRIPPGALARAFDAAQQTNRGQALGLRVPERTLPRWLAIGPSTIPSGQTDTTAGPAQPVSGRLQAIAVHPTNANIVYAGGAQGGVWKTTNALAATPTWTPLTDSQATLAIGAIALDPVDPNIVYVGTGEAAGSCDSYYGKGILRSADGGTTWTLLGGASGGPFLNHAVSQIVIDPVSAGSTTTTVLWASTTLGAVSSGTSQCLTAPTTDNGGVWRSTDSGQNWTRLDVPAGVVTPFHQVHDLALDPSNSNVLYAAVRSFPTPSLGGVWKSVNAKDPTPTFTKMGTGFADTATASPSLRRITLGIGGPGAPSVLYAALADSPSSNLWGLYKTTNGGTTWSNVDNGNNGTGNTTGTTLTRSTGPAFTSTMSGRRIIFNNNVSRTVSSVTDANTLVFSGAALALAGATWSVANYPLFCDGQCFYDMTVGVDPTSAGGGTVYVGGNPHTFNADTSGVPGSHYLWRSTDGGGTWRAISQGDSTGGIHTDDHALTFDSSVTPARLYNGNDGGIWRTDNQGVSWTNMNTNIAITQFQGVATHPTDRTIVLGGTQDNGTNIRNVGAVTPPAWFHTDFGDGGQALIDQANPNRMFHTYFNQAFNFMGPAKSTTGGNNGPGNWDFAGAYFGYGPQYYNGMDPTDQVSFYAPLATHPATNPNLVYFGSDTLYRSADPLPTLDQTPSWTPVSGDLVNGFLSAIGVFPTLISGNEVIYLGASTGAVFRASAVNATSACPGVNCPAWPNIAVAPLPARFVTDLKVTPADATANTAYATFSGFNANTPTAPGHVFRTINGLAITPTWTDISGDLPDVPANAITVDPTTTPETLYVGTDMGVFRSTNGGTNWVWLSDGHPNVAVFGLERNPTTGQVVSATHGRGMFELQAPDLIFEDGFQ